MDAESEPLEDPIETEETQPLYPRTAPLSPDYTLASPDYTLDTPHSVEESEPIEAPITRTASPSDYTSPLSPDHQLTQTSPTPIPSRAFYYRSTACMVVRTQPILSPGIFARVTEAASLSLSSFRRGCRIRERGVEGRGPGAEGEEASPEQQQQAVLVEDTIADEPLGLRYKAARRRALELVEDPAPNIEIDPRSRAPVQTPTSPEWLSGSLLVSPASLTIPSPVASPVTTPAATIVVDEDEFIKVGAQLELHGSILQDHTQRLDALPPTLLEGMGQDITELYDRLAAVRGEIHSQHFRLVSLELRQEQATITFGALWQPVLALEAWAG
ncbi:hypothetical protein Tco_0859240 [Tanacetum coccineum]|uniref:Uncharacterized protein n=1 Tax=Tanacetum coccineum TaxID=301880 RepID=A0ABQ5BFD3_9ASTR